MIKLNAKNKLGWLITINVVLLLLVSLGLLFSPERRSERSAALSVLADASLVASVELSSAEGKIMLVKNVDTWQVEREAVVYPADGNRIKAFLEALALVKRGDRVAAKNESWPQLGLDDANSVTLSLLDAGGKLISTMRTGNYASGTGSVYVALGEQEAAWRVSGGFASYVKGAYNLWYDLRIFQGIAPADIQSLQVQGRIELAEGNIVSADYRLQRWQNGWVVQDEPDTAIAAAKVESMLRAWTSARAESFVFDNSAQDLSDGLLLSATLGDGSVYSMRVSTSMQDDKYTAFVQPLRKQLRMSAWAIRESVKQLSDLSD